MGEHFDVVVVGARCAGSPLATKLANRGLRVAVVDRARFPSDTLSTHIFQNDAVRIFDDLGVLGPLLASGAPWVERLDLRLDGLSIRHRWPVRAGDPGPWLCVRRPVLDTALVDAAAEAGASVRTGMTVTGLVERDGRVAGVRVRADEGAGGAGGTGGEDELLAPLVVGADGRGSTVARCTGARRYNTAPNERLACWAYYEGASAPAPATFFAHRWDEEFVTALPCDGGLFLVIVIAPAERAGHFTRDVERAFDAHVARCGPIADLVAGGRRAGPPVLAARWTSYFRESAGPGWVLTGDAGHFKDPSPGQGITDAVRQAERLAQDIVDGLGGSRPLDGAMTSWWRWRDRDAREMAWVAGDFGRAGAVPPVLVEILAGMASDEAEIDRFVDVLNHRVRPSQILTPSRLLAATGRLLRRGDLPRSRVLAETRQIVARDLQRRWLNHRPRFDGPAIPGGTRDPVG
jgi:2-polyprenyl-6-methoxyphenol hydroxylase-like FAD-dependent oxidoreductase